MDPVASTSHILEERITNSTEEESTMENTPFPNQVGNFFDSPKEDEDAENEEEEEAEDEETDQECPTRDKSLPIFRRVDVISSTMNPMVEQLVADAAVIAVNQFDVEKEQCRFLKQYLDAQIGPYFHCIAGRRFGARVSASCEWSFCFRIEQYTFLVFRSNGDSPIVSRRVSESSENHSSSTRNSFS